MEVEYKSDQQHSITWDKFAIRSEWAKKTKCVIYFTRSRRRNSHKLSTLDNGQSQTQKSGQSGKKEDENIVAWTSPF